MLRSGVLEGVKIGQMWLIEIDALEAYLDHVETTSDHRFGSVDWGFILGGTTTLQTISGLSRWANIFN